MAKKRRFDFTKKNKRSGKVENVGYLDLEQDEEQSRCSLYFYGVILSRLVDTFFSRISLTMQLSPKPHNTAYVLPWEEGLHWQSRSSGCSSN